MATPSLVFIGEGNIVLSSLQDAKTFGFEIKAVFTNTYPVQTWCKLERVAVFPRAANLCSSLQNVDFDFDYLMSINNPRILKEDELKLARRLNVNYHDSLLPAYAGVNASSWAILQGEVRHGISLHVIEVGIDTGNILENEEVEVLPADSALSLNLRCVEAFRTAFTRLLTKIASGAPLTFRAQDTANRSYFGLHACPPNMGILSFDRDFRSLHNLARALEYGHHENPLGSPKVLTSSGRYLLVTNAEMTQRTPPSPDTEPGTITDVVDDTLIVKTATDLVLLSVAELDGSPIHPKKFHSYGLGAGYLLQSPIGPPAHLMTDVRKKESFWRRTMHKYEPTIFLRQKLNLVSDVIDVSEAINVKEVTLTISPVVATEQVDSADFLLLASFVSFVARICCCDQVHVGLLADKSKIPQQYKDLYADICPCILKVDQSLNARAAFNQCKETLTKFMSSRTFFRDMIYRYPELEERRRETRHNIVLATPADLEHDPSVKTRVLNDCNILIVLTTKKVTICYNEKPTSSHQHIVETCRHFSTYITSFCNLGPDKILMDVDLMSSEEKTILYPLPTTKDAGFEPQGSDPALLFQQICRQSPDTIALRSTYLSLSYRQAEKAIKDIADLLKQHLPESYKKERKCLALHLPNSVSYVLSVMASVYVQCPFLPLPADLPTERLAFTLRDAKATVMMTTETIFSTDKFQDLRSKPEVLFKLETPDATLVMLQFHVDENDNILINGVHEEATNGFPKIYSFDDMQVLDSGEAVLLDDCCYVMYTSGSTGRPKGVQVRTSGVVNLAKAQIKAWDLGSEDTTAQFASIGFDASISEIMTALLSGGTLAVLQEHERLGKEFVEALDEMEVTVITLPPSVLNTYSPHHLPKLRKIVTAGEACTSHTAFKWTQGDNEGKVRFFNAYGPTETTVCATVYEFRKEDYPYLATQELAIGKAIEGVAVFVLDDYLRPVPPEVVGEIFIGGAGVSGGYIGHASRRNASRFIPNPLLAATKKSTKHALKGNDLDVNDNGIQLFNRKVRFFSESSVIEHAFMESGKRPNKMTLSTDDLENSIWRTGLYKLEDSQKEEPAAGSAVPTLYRTGDHAFLDKHGRLTFVGRLDDQVKIRGQRVDLSEIAQVILQHAKVDMAAVVIHRCPQSQEPTIAAFVAPTSIYTSELKEYLTRALPSYMIPTYIRKIEARDFPISINGKVNRRALEADESVHESLQNVGSSHLNEAQLTMAKLWCSVLGLDEAHAYSLHRLSSFSSLGGNSLHLVIMQRLIEDTFNVHLSFLDVGAADTIENFTDIVKRKDMLKVSATDEVEENTEQLRRTILNDSTFRLEEILPEVGEGERQLHYMNQERRRSSERPGPLRILISGVTGFLGAFLLAEVLDQTDWQVLCMVREKGEAKGIGRVVENLKRYNLWRQSFFPRLAIVLSEVSEPNLGIAPDIYQSLCLNVDIIFINAAKMNFNTSYDDHRQANVLGTKEFLKLAFKGKKKFLFLTSSLSVFLFPHAYNADKATTTNADHGEQQDQHPLMKESDFLNDPLLVEGGYGQSKWASERLVLQALNHLPGGAIFRPARVSGHSDSGAGPKNDLFASLLYGVQTLGAFPDMNFPFDLTPVDFCAKAMVEITTKVLESSDLLKSPFTAVKTPPMPRVFHLFNKKTVPFSQLFEDSKAAAVPLDEWRRQVRVAGPDCLLLPLAPFFQSTFWDRASRWPVFDTTNTDAYISNSAQLMLKPTSQLLPVNKRYFNLPQ